MAATPVPFGPSVTIVFPGQGSQRAGMGRDFLERFESARRVYAEASDAVGFDVGALCFGDDERLCLTEHSQPAILTTQVAMLRALAEGWGLEARRFGGHSLGEYTALVAAGVIPLADAVRIVRERGRLMQQAVPVGDGGMLAVLGDSLDREAVARRLDGLRVDIANDNSRSQLVLSGPAGDVREAGERLIADAACGVERAVELDVSAPFHSWMMSPVEAEFSAVLEQSSAAWDASRAAAVTSNLSGGFHETDTASIRTRLAGQLSGTVRWRDNMSALTAEPSTIFEVGPSRTLRGFFRSLGVDVVSVVDVRSAERALSRQVAA